MKKFEVGEEVVSLLTGHGVVTDLYIGHIYPVHVYFSYKKDANESFTREGRRLRDDVNPEIYHLEDFKKRFDLPLYSLTKPK